MDGGLKLGGMSDMAGQAINSFLRGMRVVLLPTLLVLAVAGCSTIIRNHGYAPSQQELRTLKIGSDTRESVAEKVGRPTIKALLEDKAWYYVQSRWEQRGFAEPQEVNREVVALTFNNAGRLRNVEVFGIEAGQIVTLSRRITAGSTADRSVLSQLFSSIGNLNPSQIVDQ